MPEIAPKSEDHSPLARPKHAPGMTEHTLLVTARGRTRSTQLSVELLYVPLTGSVMCPKLTQKGRYTSNLERNVKSNIFAVDQLQRSSEGSSVAPPRVLVAGFLRAPHRAP